MHIERAASLGFAASVGQARSLQTHGLPIGKHASLNSASGVASVSFLAKITTSISSDVWKYFGVVLCAESAEYHTSSGSGTLRLVPPNDARSVERSAAGWKSTTTFNGVNIGYARNVTPVFQ
jgi:hypothetical protein